MINNKRVKVLAIIPAIIPSTQILIIKPLLSLHQQKTIKLSINLEHLVNLSDFSQVDVVVFSRNISTICINWLNYLLTNGIPFIYDIDDNFFDIPKDYSDFANIVRSPQHQYVISQFIAQANFVRVYSLEMEKRLKDFSNNVVLVPGPIDWKKIICEKKKKNSKINIIYATSRINDDKLSKIFESSLINILNKYNEKINIYFWGFHPKLEVKNKNIFYLHYETNYDKYLQKLSSSGFDIGLAPLINDPFHRSKSNIKYREYAASHIAGIYSNNIVYSNDVTNYQNGILVENTQESWFTGISNLIENDELRENIKNNAFIHAKNHYSQKAFERLWLEQINELYNSIKTERIEEKINFTFENKINSVQKKTSLSFIQKKFNYFAEKDFLTIIHKIKHGLLRRLQYFILQYKLWRSN